jgi:hypothetical protein
MKVGDVETSDDDSTDGEENKEFFSNNDDILQDIDIKKETIADPLK